MAATLYVATNSAHVSPFSSWPSAATSINAAVETAQNGDTVIVSNGTYYLSSTIPVYSYLTLISLNGPSNTIIDGQNQVRCIELRANPSTVSGFTIRQGYSFGNDSAGGGGGIYADGDGTISNCIVFSNRARRGGGIFAENCRITIRDCAVISNTAFSGGGIFISDAGSVLDSDLMGNTAKTGGGIYLSDLNSGLIRNCLIAENRATPSYASGGGAVVVGIVSVESCTIYNNSSDNNSGGLYFMSLYGSDYSPTTRYTVVNTICYSNSVPSSGVGTNCVIDRTDTTFAYCDISPAPAGIGNFDADPILANTPQGDYSLGGRSPCVDAGPPYSEYSWLYYGNDLSGSSRASGVAVDIGAYETSIASLDIYNIGTIETRWSVPVGAIVKLSSATNLLDPLWSEVGIFTSQTHTISIPDTNFDAIHKFYKLHWLRE